jgi:lysophospholipase L1-like esterase
MNQKKKIILAAIVSVLVIALAVVVAFSENLSNNNVPRYKLARVACLGDSITQLTDYPADLQAMLGNDSVVGNFGVSGATVNFQTDKPYYFEQAFRQARGFLPTTVVIMLGTNDARADYYDLIGSFVIDYERLINRTQSLSSDPKIFLVAPPPIFNNTLSLNETTFSLEILPRIYQVASAVGLPVIDVNTPLLNHPEYFSDGVHPNSQGAQIIANIIYKAITSG